MQPPRIATPPQPPLELRVAELERDRHRRVLSELYGRFYAPLAIATAILVFMPILDPVIEQNGDTTLTTPYGTLWEMSDEPGGGYAQLAIIFAFVMVALLTAAAVRTRGAVLPLVLAALAGVLILMLLLKPGTEKPTPDLADGGVAGLVLGWCTMALGIVHAVHLAVRGRRS